MKETNGIDVQELKNTCRLIEDDPELAQTEFRIKNTWISGGHNQVKIHGFYGAKQEQPRRKEFQFDADEPHVLLGNDIGANPVEYLLLALSSCMTTSIAYHAASRGITIESMHSEFKGELDLQGFLNLSHEVPIGYKKIEATFWIKTEAPVEAFKDLYKFSPVYNMLSKAVPIQVYFVHE